VKRLSSRLGLPFVLMLFLVLPGVAQGASPQEEAVAEAAAAPVEPGSKVLTLDDYNRWRTVTGATISADGRWAAFAYEQRRETDSELHIRSLVDDRQHLIERGSAAVLSDDGRWAAYKISMGWEELEAAEAAAEAAGEETADPVPVQVQLMDVDSGETWTWDDVASFQIARGSRALAARRDKVDKEAEHEGTDMIVRYLAAGTEELLGSVQHFAFNKYGTHLAYTVDAADDNGNGLYLIDLESGTRWPLDNAKEDYERLSWSEEGTSLAVLRGSKPEGMDELANVLIAFPDVTVEGMPAKVIYDPSLDADFPADFVVSERGRLQWNDSGTQVFFGIKEQLPEPERQRLPLAGRPDPERAEAAGRSRSRLHLSVGAEPRRRALRAPRHRAPAPLRGGR